MSEENKKCSSSFVRRSLEQGYLPVATRSLPITTFTMTLRRPMSARPGE